MIFLFPLLKHMHLYYSSIFWPFVLKGNTTVADSKRFLEFWLKAFLKFIGDARELSSLKNSVPTRNWAASLCKLYTVCWIRTADILAIMLAKTVLFLRSLAMKFCLIFNQQQAVTIARIQTPSFLES